MRPQHELVDALRRVNVRHMLVGMAGANCWAFDGSQVVALNLHEFWIEPDPPALRAAWTVMRDLGYTLREDTERIADPCAPSYAESVVLEGRSTTGYRMRDRMLVEIQTALHGKTFEEAWSARRTFRAGEIPIDVARLAHILDAAWMRDRGDDHLLVATWSQGMHDLLEPDPRWTAFLAERRARKQAGLAPPG